MSGTVGDVYRLAIVGRMDTGQALVNTAYFKVAVVAAANPDSALKQLVQAWIDAVQALYLHTFCGNANVSRYEVRGVTNPDEGYVHLLDEELSGLEGSSYSAPQNATEVIFKDGMIGRMHMNRVYHWPMSEDVVGNGVLSASHLANVTACWNAAQAIGDGVALNTYTHIVYSAKYGNSLPVDSFYVIPRVRTQRSRTLGFGN